MVYNFICDNCGKEFEIDIPVQQYDEQKDKQVCKECGSHLQRKIEWHGIAIGSGQGWCGNSKGNVI